MDKTKTEVIPYLTFNGGCEEAVNAYIEAFGGEILYMSRWSEGTASVPGQQGRVMHAEFLLGGTRMAAGDNFDAESGDRNIRLMVHTGSVKEAERAIAALAKGGEVLAPLHPHPAPDDGGCGSFTRDRFGYDWIITCPNPDYKEDK